MKFVRVDMSAKTVVDQSVPDAYRGIGGRALTSSYINDHVPATCDPLGPENVLIFAPGYFSGTPLINTSRLSVVAKSPLTGGIKESNVGGTVAAALAHLGITALVVEGRAAADECWVLHIDADGAATLVDAMDYKGSRTYALVEKLKAAHGVHSSITCIGPAGEMQLAAASIQTTDLDGRPCRAAGRGGLGAVMGAKGLKAIIVSRKGKSADPLADPEAFKAAAKEYAQAVKADAFSGEILPALGSACLVAPINEAGALPTRNAREGQFEGAEQISGETMARIIRERGGKNAHKGCAQCIIDCSNEFVDPDGRYVTASLEYETIWSMGAMIGNSDLDSIARLDFLCDDIGLDTISTGVAVAVAMDAGYKSFGDARAAI
ncbi:MAG: aldehyde ferredoxin oxidoreductase N-terminal domain-containing protein, partial [Desulfobacteraceae bacterium]|nr:aldehyde ferredoxin oxidoreductase N-terminal domain-containing protein [Desulfobacteraceae bacterium]